MSDCMWCMHVAGNFGDANIWRNIKSVKPAGYWRMWVFALFGYHYFVIKVSCHEWQLPLMTHAFDIQVLFCGV